MRKLHHVYYVPLWSLFKKTVIKDIENKDRHSIFVKYQQPIYYPARNTRRLTTESRTWRCLAHQILGGRSAMQITLPIKITIIQISLLSSLMMGCPYWKECLVH